MLLGDDVDAPAEHISYAELDRRARGVAAWLAARLPTGSRVLLVYPPVGFITGFLGCLYAGMIAVPAPLPGNYRHERRRVRRIAADAGVAAVLTDVRSLATVIEWTRQHELTQPPVLATDGPDVADPGTWPGTGPAPDSLALLQYTSGSTGEPKGVMVGHDNLLANAALMARTLHIAPGTRFGGWAPHYHDMGLMAQTLPALLRGSTCVLLSPGAFVRRPVRWLQAIDRYDIGWSAAPNFGYELCTRRISAADMATVDLSRWRHAVNGSEPVRADTMAAFADHAAVAGFRPESASSCYGLAEATVFVSGAPPRTPTVARVDSQALANLEFRAAGPDDAARRLPGNGSAAGYDVRVVDPVTRAVLPPGRIGELWLRGPSVARGYWGNAGATEETFRARTADADGGFLRTGDLGLVDDGEIYVTGRMKEMMVLHGRNLYPQDIEQELRAHHPELGNIGAAFSVETSATDDREALVVTHELRERIPGPGLRDLAVGMRQTVTREFGVGAAGIVLLRRGHVRRTTSGKIERSAMRKMFLAGELEALHSDLSPALAAHRTARSGADEAAAR
ncbi:AMP-binding protein [Mangrovihabitans endophyticus]|uniref:AMP-binding protein n=1 Tax=Mangrovihabitans endophyticus TaxID=1751298 RepID=A0A8J3FKJ0_9ACTN|nr:AMP-binding protein [Mangrovihabitans endophyticus]